MPLLAKRSGKDAAANGLIHRILLFFNYRFNIKMMPERYEYEGKALQP